MDCEKAMSLAKDPGHAAEAGTIQLCNSIGLKHGILSHTTGQTVPKTMHNHTAMGQIQLCQAAHGTIMLP